MEDRKILDNERKSQVPGGHCVDNERLLQQGKNPVPWESQAFI